MPEKVNRRRRGESGDKREGNQSCDRSWGLQ